MTKKIFTKEEAKEIIKGLVEKFEAQKEYYKTTNYNETQTRQDFINPFFMALNWDVNNSANVKETERPVIHEDKQKTKEGTKSPDYAFTIKGYRKFFVEAKKPSISIKEDPEPAFQTRQYGWNAKLSLSVLTDFEEFAIYDCTKKIRKNDTAFSKRIKYIYYTDYLKNFDFIWDTFEFNNVVNDSVEKYARTIIDFKTAEPVDKEFLNSLNQWRTYLATSISLKNSYLQEEDINFAVQLIIDRIVFLRVCEDRHIEPAGQLEEIANSKTNVYQNLFEYFQTADKKYNSGLFDLEKDKITQKLDIDNKVIRTIIKEFFETRYDFAIMPIEILGYAYEQFLGKVIRLTAGHRAIIEEKPEVRKAGGVYYTPDYIVNYMVENTIGKLIEGKTPNEVSHLKVLDPSCGSGSFLIGAYQFLLNWHLDYYLNFAKVSNFDKVESPLSSDNKLTSKEKKRILLNNIFGVDIDTQAVEVTKLSLLLKALEGETEATIKTSLLILKERVLPTIDNNIQCGNSLIAPDFYNDGLFLTPKEERKINIFDWKMGFPQVFKQGGFDVVIGNPPWSAKMNNLYSNYISKRFDIQMKNMNLFAPFVANSFRLISKIGVISLLIPKVFIKNSSYKSIRKEIIENYHLREIIDFGKFPNVASDCVSPVIAKKTDENCFTSTFKFVVDTVEFQNKVEQSSFALNPIFAFSIDIDTEKQKLLETIKSQSIVLGEIASIKRGIELGQKSFLVQCENCNHWNETGDKYYNTEIEKNCKKCGNSIQTKERTCISSEKKGGIYSLKCVSGRDVSKYVITHNYFIPKTMQGVDYKNQIFDGDRIFIKRIATKPEGIFIGKETQLLAFNTIYSIYDVKKYDTKFVLGILNSKLSSFFYEFTFNIGMNLTSQITVEYLKQLPIKVIDFENTSEKSLHDKIVSLVDMLLELNRRLQDCKLQTDKNQYQRRIDYTEQEINNIVYQLYEISETEQQIIERTE